MGRGGDGGHYTSTQPDKKRQKQEKQKEGNHLQLTVLGPTLQSWFRSKPGQVKR